MGHHDTRGMVRKGRAGAPGSAGTWSNFLASGPVSRILFHALRRFSRHFSHILADVSGCGRLSPAAARMRHTRGYGTSRPATYFALHRKGFFVPSRSRATRWALTPPFHHHLIDLPRGESNGLSVFCDTVRQRALTRVARTCGEARAASCSMVSGLSSPNFLKRARHYPRLGIKELGATTRPRS